jgi:hypothetical protein
LLRWKLVGLAGIGAALLALGMLRSPWRGRAAGADAGLALVAGLRALACRRQAF